MAQRARWIARGVSRMLAELGAPALAEVPLASGRRADLLALGPRGEFTLVEIKSCAADYLADGKWREYAPWCDRFYFAVDGDFPVGLLPPETGLIVADGFGGAVLREGGATPLAPARRKALTLAFARLAASRLLRAGDAAAPAGRAAAEM